MVDIFLPTISFRSPSHLEISVHEHHPAIGLPRHGPKKESEVRAEATDSAT